MACRLIDTDFQDGDWYCAPAQTKADITTVTVQHNKPDSAADTGFPVHHLLH